MDQVFAQLIKIHSNYNAEADSKKIFLLDEVEISLTQLSKFE